MASLSWLAHFVLLSLLCQTILAFEPITIIAASIGIVTNIVVLARQLWQGVEYSKLISNDQPIGDQNLNKLHDPASINIISQLRYLSKSTEQLKADIGNVQDELTNKIAETVPGLVELNRRLSIIFVNSLNVGKSYDNFLRYVEEPEKFDQNILKNFALKTISEDTCGLNYLLDEIHTLLTLSDGITPSAIHLLIRHMEIFLKSAKIHKSPQQLLYNILNSITYTEIKGYLTMQFSFQLLTLYKAGHYEGHIEKLEYEFANRINKTINTFKTAMAAVSRELWKDDPVQHLDGVTFTELKHVFQDYIVNEYDISTDDSCWNKCHDYKTPSEKTIGRCYYNTEICAYQRSCDGFLYNCMSTFADLTIYVCPSEKNSTRRYQYVENQYGKLYGSKKEKCSTDVVKTTYHNSFARQCDTCLCICADTSSKSERYFSLEPSMARYEDNYVVTGARLIKQNNTVHIQIQEGQLLPSGNINQSTVSWVPINYNPKNVHTLIWDQSRGINLDDLEAQSDHVLIGLSFSSEIHENNYKRIHLKIHSAPLNFTAGKLSANSNTSTTISPSSNDQINLQDLDIPTRPGVGTITRSKSNQYLKFEPSGLEYDIGQSTIPFIDMQNITTNPPIPLSGAGIYYRKKPGKGGFIALKVFTFDFGEHLQANLPEEYKILKNHVESSTKSSTTLAPSSGVSDISTNIVPNASDNTGPGINCLTQINNGNQDLQTNINNPVAGPASNYLGNYGVLLNISLLSKP